MGQSNDRTAIVTGGTSRISRHVFFEDSWHIAEAMRP